MKNVVKPLAKSVLIPLGLTASASATDAAAIQKKVFEPGMARLIISNEEMNYIMKIFKSLVYQIAYYSGLFTKGVSGRIKNEAKEQNGGFPGMLLGILVSNLLGNLLTGKGAKAKKLRKEAIRAGEGAITAGQNF